MDTNVYMYTLCNKRGVSINHHVPASHTHIVDMFSCCRHTNRFVLLVFRANISPATSGSCSSYTINHFSRKRYRRLRHERQRRSNHFKHIHLECVKMLVCFPFHALYVIPLRQCCRPCIAQFIHMVAHTWPSHLRVPGQIKYK